ncbi:MAG: aspartate/glutamate racemase family protein [Dehalococcoidales bacterium]|nr:aspartate/glutamate racemase family protein [Dehalococcoidales bacterium]
MKVIGLIGGMSWESSAEYYRLINEYTKEKLSGWHSSRCMLYSLDFAEIEKWQDENDWVKLTAILIDAARKLEAGGAECILICTNTMHKTADEIQKAISIPLIHIVDVTGEEIRAKGLRTVGLLGTKYTMEDGFYTGRLSEKYGLEVLIPDKLDKEVVHNVIYNELCLGKTRQASKEKFRTIISKLEKRGARGIILGCTEIPLLIKQEDLKIPVFDTTRIHAKAGVDFALQ